MKETKTINVGIAVDEPRVRSPFEGEQRSNQGMAASPVPVLSRPRGYTHYRIAVLHP
jgi:hypothetical protein